MSRKTLGLPDDIHRYVLDVGIREDDLLRRLRAETDETMGDDAEMQISAEQGAFMQFLATALGVKKAIEVGTFTGYSSICVARALPADGKIVCIDSSDEFTKTARKYWKEAGLADKVDLRLGDGLDQLDRMIASGESGNYDFCFHDADKADSREIVERFLRLLRPGGVFLIDNALRDGDVLRPARIKASAGTREIEAMNRQLRDDERIDWCLIPLADGIAMGRKRG